MDSEGGGQEDSSVPPAAAWLMFRQYMGWQSDRTLGVQKDCIVHRDWRIYRYLLARGLVGSTF